MKSSTVHGNIFRRREREYDAFNVSLETTIGCLVKQFYPREKVTFTYHGNLLSPVYSLRLYNFKDGDVIVATTESEIPEILPLQDRRVPEPGQFGAATLPGISRLFTRSVDSIPAFWRSDR
jgi:hypothetical protein